MRVWPVSAVLTIWYREHSDPSSLMNLISPCGQRVWGQKQPAYSGLPCQRSLVFRYLIAYRLRGGIWKDPALPFSSSTGGNHPSLFVRAMSLGLRLQLSRGVNSHPLGQPPSNLTLSPLPKSKWIDTFLSLSSCYKKSGISQRTPAQAFGFYLELRFTVSLGKQVQFEWLESALHFSMQLYCMNHHKFRNNKNLSNAI